MVIAESEDGQNQPTHSPIEVPQQRKFGFSPSEEKSEYSGSEGKPPFGLAPAKHIYPESEIEEPGGPFGLPTRKKVELDKDVKTGWWHKLDSPKFIPSGGKLRLQRKRGEL